MERLPNEKTPVRRVSITLEGNPRELREPYVQVDGETRTVHIWLEPDVAEPTLSAPLHETRIEWSARVPEEPTAPPRPV